MIIDPNKIVFENEEDIIDYVTKGITPPRRRFEDFMNKMNDPDANLPEDVFNKIDRPTLEMVLNRAYENRVRNRNNMLAIAGGIATVILIGCIRSGIKNSHSDSDCDSIAMSDPDPNEGIDVPII